MMGELRALREYVFTDLEGVPREDVKVRYRFLEDPGDPSVSPETGIEAWSEPSLVIRFIIYHKDVEVSRLDVRFAREEWPDVQDTADDVLNERLQILLAARARSERHRQDEGEARYTRRGIPMPGHVLGADTT